MTNQILAVDNTNKSKKRRGPIEIKKIVIFFAIITIIFSLSCVGIGTYAIFENNDILGNTKPEISMQKDEDKLLVSVTAVNPIDRITYKWNDEETKEIKANNETYFEDTIDVPLGENTIELVAYDVKGKIAKSKETYIVEEKAPQVSIEGSNGKIKITAKDNEKMSYLTYRWDDEEEKRIDATEESSAQIEKEIEIPAGQHTLTVVAVNSRNLTKTKEQQVKGVKKPYITVVQDADDLKYLILSVTDEEAVKDIIFDLNGKEYELNLSNYHEKSIQYRIEMEQGDNIIKITAVNFDGAESKFEGECTYNP